MCAFVPKCNFSLSGQNVHRKDLWHNAISACDILHLKSLICHFPLFIDYMSFMPFSILVFCLLIDIIILFCSFESMSCFAFRFERHWLSHLTSISVLVWKLTFKDSQGSRKLKVLIFKRSDFFIYFFFSFKKGWLRVPQDQAKKNNISGWPQIFMQFSSMNNKWPHCLWVTFLLSF